MDKVMTAETDILLVLRRNAVALVDAFDYTDDCLQSCIGCYDGEVYQRLFDNAKNSPMNKNEVSFFINHIYEYTINKFA